MFESTASASHQLSPNLIPFISDSSISMALVKITGHESAGATKSGLETGLLKLDILEVIHSSVLNGNESVEAPFERHTDPQLRLRNQFNAWNTLSLDSGQMLVLALKAHRAGKVFAALAGIPVSSPSDPQVAAIKECYRIETTRDNPKAKRELLGRALEDPQDLLRFYAMDAITKRHALDRQGSAALMEAALNSKTLSPASKQDLGFQLVSGQLFDETLEGDSVNVGIVSALAKQMVESSDAKSRDQWLAFLSSCVARQFSDDQSKDREMRLALVRAVRYPDPQSVTSSLMTASREAGSSDEAQPAKRLLEIWQRAFNR